MMDRILSFCGSNVTSERAMDSNALEKERGITILSKYTSVKYEGFTVNAVDTPGHADFGGEVERVLGMVDGCILLVDASEGPLSQTKFVLEKALSAGLRPIVVLNKVDRDAASPDQCGQVAASIFDLFALLGATEEQLDFPLLYASGRGGWVSTELPPQGQKPADASMKPLLDAILKNVPPPTGEQAAPFRMLVTMLERDNYFGKILTGRIASGTVRVGDRIKAISGGADGAATALGEGKVTKIFKKAGLMQIEMSEAGAGDIVSLAGCDAAMLTSTLCAAEGEPSDSEGRGKRFIFRLLHEYGQQITRLNRHTCFRVRYPLFFPPRCAPTLCMNLHPSRPKTLASASRQSPTRFLPAWSILRQSP